MKILSLSNCPLDHALGSGRTRLAWAEGLRSLGHEVTLVESVELLGGDEGTPKGRRLRLARGAWRYLRTLDLSRYDVIEFFGAEFWLATWQLSRRRSRPLLVAHTDGLELLADERARASLPPAGRAPGAKANARQAVHFLKQRLDRLAFTRADAFVTASGADRDYLLRHRLLVADKIAVILLGLESLYLDLPWLPAREERVVYLGSWIDRKGLKPLIHVMTSLLRERPVLHFDIYGVNAAQAEALMAFPEEIRPRITVYPRLPISEIIAGVSRAKVFFFPSEYEGFGLALAEAMACGCAVVTTPTGFGADLIEGQEALICNFGDAPAMGEAIRRLLDDDALRVKIAEARIPANSYVKMANQRTATRGGVPRLAASTSRPARARMKVPPQAELPREFASVGRDGWMLGDGVVVLMYHKIARPPATTNLPSLYVPAPQLRRQLDELFACGSRCVPFADLLVANSSCLNGFCLTFDDGFSNVFDHALPLLAARKLRSIQFIVASLVGQDDAWDRSIGEPPQRLMDEAQIRDWLGAGQTIGSHTLTHPRLADIPLADARREIFDSKKLLEDQFGVAIDHFCYPYGSFNEAVRDLVGEAGYKAACTVEFGSVQPLTNPLALPRVMATSLPSPWRRVAKQMLKLVQGSRS